MDLGSAPAVMGILNVTPDSFFDGGAHALLENAIAQAERMVAEGAAIIDVGGQSTRPGFEEISADDEVARVIPVIEALVRRGGVTVSIDTYKPAVARAALEAGAQVLNDIHGLQRAPELARLAADYGAAVVAMHHDEHFREAGGDPVARMKEWLGRSLEIAAKAGVAADRVAIDPGIGFFKTQTQTLEILGRLDELKVLGVPVVLGTSRKSFIGRVLDDQPAAERLEGTLATTAVAAWQGVEVVRVHDVRANVRVARMAHAIRSGAAAGVSFSS
jgi:dihydropteroate synthase